VNTSDDSPSEELRTASPGCREWPSSKCEGPVIERIASAIEPGERYSVLMLAIKERISRPLEKAVVDQLVKLAFNLGIGPPGDSLLETTGRGTGRTRRSRICDGLEGQVFWLLAQYRRSTDYGQDIEANSRVRVFVRSGPRAGWRRGTARILDDDDPFERVRTLGRDDFWRRLCLRASAALATSLLTVRIDLDPFEQRSLSKHPSRRRSTSPA
jgi:hypothetical protein